MRAPIVWVGILTTAALQVGVTVAPDDPIAARPPQDAAPLPPIQEPYRTPVERRDLVQKFLPPSPIEGFWRLREHVVGGQEFAVEANGYLVAGRQFLSLNLAELPVAGDKPAVQAGFWRYRVERESLVMQSLLGYDNLDEGELAFERGGMTETRRFRVAGALLRVIQGEGSYMEFERIE